MVFARFAVRLAALVLVSGFAAGCVTVGTPPPRPVLSDDPAAGPAACYSECTLLGGCESRCGYVEKR